MLFSFHWPCWFHMGIMINIEFTRKMFPVVLTFENMFTELTILIDINMSSHRVHCTHKMVTVTHKSKWWCDKEKHNANLKQKIFVSKTAHSQFIKQILTISAAEPLYVDPKNFDSIFTIIRISFNFQPIRRTMLVFRGNLFSFVLIQFIAWQALKNNS